MTTNTLENDIAAAAMYRIQDAGDCAGVRSEPIGSVHPPFVLRNSPDGLAVAGGDHGWMPMTARARPVGGTLRQEVDLGIDWVIIDRRFNGPPNSANGGYTCGLVGTAVDAPSVRVSLRKPPPLNVPLLRHREDDGSVSLLGGDDLIATGVPAAVQAHATARADGRRGRDRRRSTWALHTTGSRRVSSAERRARTACGSTLVRSETDP